MGERLRTWLGVVALIFATAILTAGAVHVWNTDHPPVDHTAPLSELTAIRNCTDARNARLDELTSVINNVSDELDASMAEIYRRYDNLSRSCEKKQSPLCVAILNGIRTAHAHGDFFGVYFVTEGPRDYASLRSGTWELRDALGGIVGSQDAEWRDLIDRINKTNVSDNSVLYVDQIDEDTVIVASSVHKYLLERRRAKLEAVLSEDALLLEPLSIAINEFQGKVNERLPLLQESESERRSVSIGTCGDKT